MIPSTSSLTNADCGRTRGQPGDAGKIGASQAAAPARVQAVHATCVAYLVSRAADIVHGAPRAAAAEWQRRSSAARQRVWARQHRALRACEHAHCSHACIFHHAPARGRERARTRVDLRPDTVRTIKPQPGGPRPAHHFFFWFSPPMLRIFLRSLRNLCLFIIRPRFLCVESKRAPAAPAAAMAGSLAPRLAAARGVTATVTLPAGRT